MIFDVGAHYGETAEEYKEIFPRADVYSFEPFAESFAVLQQNAAKMAGVHAINLALSDFIGEAAFHSNVGCSTNSLLPIAQEAAEVWPGLMEAKAKAGVNQHDRRLLRVAIDSGD